MNPAARRRCRFPAPSIGWPVDTSSPLSGRVPNPTVQRATPSWSPKTARSRSMQDPAKPACPTCSRVAMWRAADQPVIQAMRDGRAAAEAIDRALDGRPVSAVDAHPAEPATRFRIISRRELGADIYSIEVEAPEIARHWRAGQFVVLASHTRKASAFR